MLDDNLIKKVLELSDKSKELYARIQEESSKGFSTEIKELSKQYNLIKKTAEQFSEYSRAEAEISDLEKLVKSELDQALIDMETEEINFLKNKALRLAEEIKIFFYPKENLQDKDILLEIRAATGGEEAALFALDLFKMYNKYALNKNFQFEAISLSPSSSGGLKEAVVSVKGVDAYRLLKYESGVHRVQRIPATETQGRVHTSAATVAVMPEAEEIDLKINNEDLRIDVYKSSGHGGQSVNTTDSAVRVTHIPTGLVVTCQDEKSQHKNKAKALRILRSRLLSRIEADKKSLEAQNRKSMVGSGDRSEKIRTYNFPQGRITDHRAGITIHKLASFMDGSLDELLMPLADYFESQKQLQS
ncbi:MAG: peptide chain release factor 1 [bacterium]